MLQPVYPFGYGLSYTTYEYADMEVEQGEGEFEVFVGASSSDGFLGWFQLIHNDKPTVTEIILVACHDIFFCEKPVLCLNTAKK